MSSIHPSSTTSASSETEPGLQAPCLSITYTNNPIPYGFSLHRGRDFLLEISQRRTFLTYGFIWSYSYLFSLIRYFGFSDHIPNYTGRWLCDVYVKLFRHSVSKHCTVTFSPFVCKSTNRSLDNVEYYEGMSLPRCQYSVDTEKVQVLT